MGGGGGGSGGSRSGQGGDPSTGTGGAGIHGDAGLDAAVSGGAGGTTEGHGGAAGASSGGAGSGGRGGQGGANGSFTCNLMVGPSPMYQFFNGGFLTYPGIDAAKWELISVAGHYTNVWAMPGDSGWNTPISHPCAKSSTAPDRVILMATQWKETTAAEWEADFDGIIANIRTKWPTVKRIELLASLSTPGDVPCPGTGPEMSETMIPAYGYAAIDAMPAKYPGLVFSTPHFEVPKCSDFINNGGGPQLAPNSTATTGPAIMEVAAVFGAYYAAHP